MKVKVKYSGVDQKTLLPVEYSIDLANDPDTKEGCVITLNDCMISINTDKKKKQFSLLSFIKKTVSAVESIITILKLFGTLFLLLIPLPL